MWTGWRSLCALPRPPYLGWLASPGSLASMSGLLRVPLSLLVLEQTTPSLALSWTCCWSTSHSPDISCPCSSWRPCPVVQVQLTESWVTAVPVKQKAKMVPEVLLDPVHRGPWACETFGWELLPVLGTGWASSVQSTLDTDTGEFSGLWGSSIHWFSKCLLDTHHVTGRTPLMAICKRDIHCFLPLLGGQWENWPCPDDQSSTTTKLVIRAQCVKGCSGLRP
jgi:hypothetical protein